MNATNYLSNILVHCNKLQQFLDNPNFQAQTRTLKSIDNELGSLVAYLQGIDEDNQNYINKYESGM